MIRFLPFLMLSACAELPPVEGTISAAAQRQPAPELAPLDPLLAEGRRVSRAAAAEGDLRARGAALSQAGVAAPETDDLAERGRRLRERAERLRAVEI
ncbi:hypothetical protein MWU52_01660 [Jannaschia sp. S6380]|uniref:hypothetical protein n=1 Tax=Jannaschia sp. S6380 TaxID=2926408 RepID=UPI001FF5F03A|nr:hypothetical protein [Jannaschia sp. S6380]MCK0166249.1 hypothetical protein [Jannaschia sp. S6380]